MDTTTLALIVAGLGVASGPFTAWLSHRWSRHSDETRWQQEREAEANRWHRQEEARRVERGEDAAKELVSIIDAAAQRLEYGSKASQSEFEPFYHDIRRMSLFITDDKTRERVLEIASALYFFGNIDYVHVDIQSWTIARAYREAGHDVLSAYVLGRPCPDTPRLARLTALIDAGAREISVDEDDFIDPLGEHETHEKRDVSEPNETADSPGTA